MPSRNTIKQLTEDGIYHVYNRGVERRVIFLDNEDYTTFINRFDQLLSDPKHLTTQQTRGRKGGDRLQSYYGEVELLVYCLMPNHFHMLVHQVQQGALPKFMSSLMTSYSMYFNRKYDRVGSLFQGRYKASLIDGDAYYMHISRYIHLNPVDIGRAYDSYPYSSYANYLADSGPVWLNHGLVLDMFETPDKYRQFVASYEKQFHDLDELYSLD